MHANPCICMWWLVIRGLEVILDVFAGHKAWHLLQQSVSSAIPAENGYCWSRAAQDVPVKEATAPAAGLKLAVDHIAKPLLGER